MADTKEEKDVKMEEVEEDSMEEVHAAKKQKQKGNNSDRNFGANEDEDGLADKARNRLHFLLEQTDIFSHFMTSPVKGKGKAKASSSGKPGCRRNLMTEDEEDKELMTSAKETKGFTRLTSQPPSMKIEMRPYQLEALNWLIKCYETGINGILADEMGLGKTCETISVLSYLRDYRNITGPHLVIVPKSTLTNWVKEIKRFCPDISALKLHAMKDERNELREELLEGEWDVCLTTYEMCIKEKGPLKKFKWKYLIIDEAHRIKNENSQLSQIVRMFTSENRLLITGTPLQNNLHELWALLNFLLPDVFANSEDFDSWFRVEEGVQMEIVSQLHKLLRPFLLRRLKADVEKSLLPKKETKLFIGMTELQKGIYTKLLSRDIDAINGQSANRARLLNIMMQLRKVCNHPYLFDGTEPGPPYTTGDHLVEASGKMVILHKLLPKLKAAGHRVLIFSQMTRVLDILEDYLFWQQYQYCRIDGQTGSDQREESIEAFNAPDSDKFVFILSTRAGGLGINLQTADTVVLFDSDWNPQVDLQAMDRCHRIGQKKEVHVYRFVTEGTIEEKIIEKAEKKMFLDAMVVQQGRLADQNRQLGKNEILGMIRFGADQILKSKDATLTDDDIDAIIARGQQKTTEMSENLKQDCQHNLLNFSLDGDISSLYEFGGKDYKELTGGDAMSGFGFVELAKRERKQNYDVNAYYRDAMRSETKTPKEPRMPKQLQLHDFQFFDPRLQELQNMEAWSYLKEKGRLEQYIAEDESRSHIKPDKVAPLTEKELAEKDKLLASGFGHWSKRDFISFYKASARYGRNEVEKIAGDVEGKTLEEVKKYQKVFWQRVSELKEMDKVVSAIEQGESKLQRRLEQEMALKVKLQRSKDAWHTLKIPYHMAGASTKGKAFTEEEDRFLICMTHKLGYGRWDELKREVRKSWLFRFDWFIKSRTAEELHRRVDVLIRLIEKENEDVQAKSKKSPKALKQQNGTEKRKSTGGSSNPKKVKSK